MMQQSKCPKCGKAMTGRRSVYEIDGRGIPVSVYVCRDCAEKVFPKPGRGRGQLALRLSYS